MSEYLKKRREQKLGIVTMEVVKKITKIKPRSKKMDKNMVICKLLLDQRFWLAVSRKGHKAIEQNPEWAKKMGFSESRLTA
jgi:hypothetical protein